MLLLLIKDLGVARWAPLRKMSQYFMEVSRAIYFQTKQEQNITAYFTYYYSYNKRICCFVIQLTVLMPGDNPAQWGHYTRSLAKRQNSPECFYCSAEEVICCG